MSEWHISGWHTLIPFTMFSSGFIKKPGSPAVLVRIGWSEEDRCQGRLAKELWQGRWQTTELHGLVFRQDDLDTVWRLAWGVGKSVLQSYMILCLGSNTLPKVIDNLGLNGLYGIGWEFNICVYICTYVCIYVDTHKEINFHHCLYRKYIWFPAQRQTSHLISKKLEACHEVGDFEALWFPFLLCHPLKIFIS